MKLQINRVDQNGFVDFINRLKAIDTFLYFKFRSGNVTSAVYLPQRDAVKLHTVEIKDLFSVEGDLPEGKELKVAFFDATKVLDALKMFQSDQIQGEIEFVENEEDFVASSMRIYNDELTITLACSDPSLGFKDLTDAQLQTIFDREGSDFNFVLDTVTLNKIRSLFSLDKEDTFTITASGEEVRVKGKTYDYQANQSFQGSASEATLYKKYLNLLDREEYNVYVSDNKVVMRSNDTNTLLTIATCQTAE
jgi:aspartate carbamoyltransferase regulatory subunit